MAKAKCLRSDYKKAKDDVLDLKASAVQIGLAANTTPFPSPPVGPTALGTLITTYINTSVAYKRGGLDQKPAFINAKNALLAALDQNADYVDEIADGSEELIVNAGYVPTKTSSTTKPLPDKPTVVTAVRGNATGLILVECKAVTNAMFYGLIMSDSPDIPGFVFQNGVVGADGTNVKMMININKSRKKSMEGLNPGTIYYFWMYAANANGISALSDTVKLMAG